jgi:hypothetical protein
MPVVAAEGKEKLATNQTAEGMQERVIPTRVWGSWNALKNKPLVPVTLRQAQSDIACGTLHLPNPLTHKRKQIKVLAHYIKHDVTSTVVERSFYLLWVSPVVYS